MNHPNFPAHPRRVTAPTWRRVSLWRLLLAMLAVAAYLAFAYFLVLA